MIPAWTFGGSLLTLAIGAFVMQAGVQGAWGIIPAHLNELSPDAVRGLMPGFAYQLGILIAAPVNNVVYALRKPLGYPWALAAFEIANIAASDDRGRAGIGAQREKSLPIRMVYRVAHVTVGHRGCMTPHSLNPL